MRGKLWPMASPCLVVTSLRTCCFVFLSFISYFLFPSASLFFSFPLSDFFSVFFFFHCFSFFSTTSPHLASFHPITSNIILSSGSGIGTFILAPVVQLLIEHYSWRGALLVLGGFVSNLCVCGALMRPLSPQVGER